MRANTTRLSYVPSHTAVSSDHIRLFGRTATRPHHRTGPDIVPGVPDVKKTQVELMDGFREPAHQNSAVLLVNIEDWPPTGWPSDGEEVMGPAEPPATWPYNADEAMGNGCAKI